MQKTEERYKSGPISLEAYLQKEQDEEFSKNNQLVIGDLITKQIVELVHTVEQLKKEVASLKERGSKGYYRKNKRVCYIPKKPLYENVLSVLRKNDNEPLKETISKVFIVAAKALGLSDHNE